MGYSFFVTRNQSDPVSFSQKCRARLLDITKNIVNTKNSTVVCEQGVPSLLSWPPQEFCIISASEFKEQWEATGVSVIVKWSDLGL